MPMNQAYNELYSDKVLKFGIFGPISNFAISLQAMPLKGSYFSVSAASQLSTFSTDFLFKIG